MNKEAATMLAKQAKWSVSYSLPGAKEVQSEKRVALIMLIVSGLVCLGVVLSYGVSTPSGWELAAAASIFVVSVAVATTSVVIRIQGRPLTFSLTDIPLVLYLILVQPATAVLVAVSTQAIVLLYQRTKTDRIYFTLSIAFTEITVAYSLYRLWAAPQTFTAVTQWVWVLAVVTATGTLMSIFVFTFLNRVKKFGIKIFCWATQTPQLIAGLVCTIMTGVALLFIEMSVWTAPSFVLLVSAASFGYQYVWINSTQVGMLNSFRDLTDDVRGDERAVMSALAQQSCHLLGSHRAEVFVGQFGLEPGTWAVQRNSTHPDHEAFQLKAPERRVVVTVFERDEDCQAILRVAQHDKAVGVFQAGYAKVLRVLIGLAISKWRSTKLLRDSQDAAALDKPTGIGNRIHLYNVLSHANTSGRLIKCRVDMLDRISTAFGIEVCHEVIEQMVKMLKDFQAVHDDVEIARVGDETFGIWLPGPDNGQFNGLLTAIQQKIVVGPIQMTLDCRVGYVDVAQGTSATETMHQAHTAVTSATQRGTQTPVPYDAEDVAATRDRVALSEELKQAISHAQLELVFQPKVHPASGEVHGAEALARWDHPSRGFIPPDVFIGIAEDSALMPGLTNFVLHRALSRCRQWQEDYPGVGVSINVSPKNLVDQGFCEEVHEALVDHDVRPELLTVEVTETDMMEDPVAVIRGLRSLREHGVQVSIDDFGTGYSSLSYLGQMPITEAKIDRSFVMSLGTDQQARSMLKHVVPLLHSVGAGVVAEGVEDVETLEFLASIGCDEAQGYLIAKPMPLDGFRQWLQSQAVTLSQTP